MLSEEEKIDREIALLESRYMEIPRAIINSKILEKEGDASFNALEIGRSVICYYDAIRLNSGNHRAHAKLMRSFYLMKDEENLEKAIKFFTENHSLIHDPRTLLIVTEVSVNLGLNDLVGELLTRLIEFEDNNAIRWLNIARLAHATKNLTLAEMAYEEAFGLDSINPLIVSSYVYFYFLRGEINKAEAILRNRLIISPEELLYWEVLDIYRKMSRIEQKWEDRPFLPKFAPFDNLFNIFTNTPDTSIRILRAKSVLSEDEENLVAIFVLAKSYADTGQNEKAEEYYQKLVELDPMNPTALSQIQIVQMAQSTT